MMNKSRKLIIVGAGEFAGMAYECFEKDSEYKVEGFAVEKKYKNSDFYCGCSVVAFEEIEQHYPPQDYDVFVAVTHVKLNRERRRLYEICKNKGYHCAHYISSRSFVWNSVVIGENVFVFEGVTIQYYAEIGNNSVVWNGVTIAHRTVIGENCWIAPAAAIAGFSRVGSNCFVGTNATIGDEVVVPDDVVLGAGTVAYKSLPEGGQVYVGVPAGKIGRTAYEQFGIEIIF